MGCVFSLTCQILKMVKQMKAQWIKLIEEYDKFSKHRTICLFQTLRSPLSRVPKQVREQWNKIIGSHRDRLSQAKDYNDLYQQIEDLKISGIGPACIGETAAKIADDYNIPVDDSCWACCYLMISLKSADLHTLRHSLDEAKLTPKQQIDFILTFRTKIRRLLKAMYR